MNLNPYPEGSMAHAWRAVDLAVARLWVRPARRMVRALNRWLLRVTR